ncbi:MAG: DUF434 domain-containing protein [Bacteroidales bacterium]|nr:DUF434 domain-containing protein [Bacteroidales bacterium]
MHAKRGYLPTDEESFSPEAVEKMRTASRHICYLINEGYDLQMASTFVGNHFALSERQRLAVVRSIATDEQLQLRKVKEITNIDGGEVWIDGFNVIITLEVMLSKSILFEGMDGTIRDLASLRGTYRIIDETSAAIKLLFDTLSAMNVARVNILLDEPVSNSGRLKVLIAEIAENYNFALDIKLLKAVDSALWTKSNVITSDSIILDHCISWVNLMRQCTNGRETQIIRVW